MCASHMFAVSLTPSFELAVATRRNINITTMLKNRLFWTPRELEQVPSPDQVR